MHEKQRFATYDQDNDIDENINYAEERHGAWWYGDGANR